MTVWTMIKVSAAAVAGTVRVSIYVEVVVAFAQVSRYAAHIVRQQVDEGCPWDGCDEDEQASRAGVRSSFSCDGNAWLDLWAG